MTRQNVQAAVAIVAMLMALFAPATSGAAIDIPQRDGWYRWETTATATAAQACCHNWQNGAVTRCTCDLDDRRGGPSIGSSVIGDDHKIRVYVKMKGGVPLRIRALSAACPVSATTAIGDLGLVAPADSIGWLALQLHTNSKNVESAVDAIALHGGEAGFRALVSVVENRDYGRDLREHALFWLAQSDSDQAFDYLDRLLSGR